MQNELEILQSGQVFYDAWKGCLTGQGDSISAWCRRNGVNQNYVRMIAFGAADGPKAREIREKMIEAAGLEPMLALYRDRLKRAGTRG